MLKIYIDWFSGRLDTWGIKREYLIYIIVFVLFWIKGVIFLDPDFGWRLKTGEYILQFGIPQTDLFTYSMPTFPWVDHAWAQSLLFAFLYSYIGKVGLAGLYSLIALGALKLARSINTHKVTRILTSIHKKSLGGNYGDFSDFLFLLAASLTFVFFGVRVQIVTWMMLALILKLGLDEELWLRYRFLIPLFFMIWANFHGGFFSGLTSLLIILTARVLKKRVFNYTDFLIFVISVGATLINPYSIGIWREVWSSVADTKLRWTINEWMPALTMLNLPMVVLGTFSTIFVWKQRKDISLAKFLLFFFFLVQAIGSRRHLPLFVLVALPTTSEAIVSFREQLSKTKDGIKRLAIAYKWAWMGVLGIIIFQLFFDFSEAVSLMEEKYYPQKAVAFLKENSYPGEIFSEYGWGGYLIWKIPDKKVFIDGRMPSWRWHAPEGETDSAFDDYNAILAGKTNYRKVFDRYNVGIVLWIKPDEETALDTYFDKAEDFLVKFGYKKRDFKLVKQLDSDGWATVYQDDNAVVLRKP